MLDLPALYANVPNVYGENNDKLGDVVPVDAIGPHHLWGFGNACELWTEALKTAVGRWVCVNLHKTWADSKNDDHGLVSSIVWLFLHTHIFTPGTGCNRLATV